jgi:hypothetical protein
MRLTQDSVKNPAKELAWQPLDSELLATRYMSPAAAIVGNRATCHHREDQRRAGGNRRGWQGNRAALDMSATQINRDDGEGFVLLTYDTTPGYVDTQPFPTAPAKWIYKAIYRVGDAPVGIWSGPLSVMGPG